MLPANREQILIKYTRHISNLTVASHQPISLQLLFPQVKVLIPAVSLRTFRPFLHKLLTTACPSIR